jgi:signal transduction histidine kinase
MALLHSLQDDMRLLGGDIVIEESAARPYPGSPEALRRCLTNLLGNAVKYGGAARVRVIDGPQRLEIRIHDNGPGIPVAELERVFEPFYRLEGSRNRTTGGTGLGLTIARNLARSHGGDLVLRNLPEGGLEAVLTLPRDTEAKTAGEPRSSDA